MSKKRKYSKRTKSTKAKTYRDYLAERAKLEAKGITLKEAMTERGFNEYYESLRRAKRDGEIKSQPFQELMRKERYLTTKQAKVMAKAYEDMTGEKTSFLKAKKFDVETVWEIGAYLNALTDKQRAIYGGVYE